MVCLVPGPSQRAGYGQRGGYTREGVYQRVAGISEGHVYQTGADIPDGRSGSFRPETWIPPVLTLSEWQLPQHIRLASRQYVFYCNVFLFDNFFQVSDL